MSETPPLKSDAELQEIGERICRSHDERWVTMWGFSLHRLFRSHLHKRKVWKRLDELIAKEWAWHLARELCEEMRQDYLTEEKIRGPVAERYYLSFGEVVAKSMSNASWRPNCYDVEEPFQIPRLAYTVAHELQDSERMTWLHYHFLSLFQHEENRRRAGF